MKLIFGLLRKLSAGLIKREYPYIKRIRSDRCQASFYVNSSVEQFRIDYWGGEKKYIETLLSHLRSNDTFLDIGASVGLISILSAWKLKQGKVYAVEPDPDICKRLEKNIGLNKVDNTKILDMLLSDKNGKAQLYTSGADSRSPSKMKTFESKMKLNVKEHTVDWLLRKKYIEAPTVVKIDVEGAEVEVVRGMKYTLNNKELRLLFIEYHPAFLEKFGDKMTEADNLIRKKGFNVFYKERRQEQMLMAYSR